MEDMALRRLEGLNVPKTYGFVEKNCNNATEIIYDREYLEGKPVESFVEEDNEPLARMMVQIHQRGVITRDPSLDNFVRTPAGKILFIDFGRSVILNLKNPAIIDFLGKELARMHCHAFEGDDQLYSRYHKAYFELFPHSKVRRFLTERIGAKWYQRFARNRM